MTSISSQISKIEKENKKNLRNLRLNPQNLRLNFFKLVISVLLACVGLMLSGCQHTLNSRLDPNRLKIEVEADGLFKLTLADLHSAGFAVAQIEPDNLYLSSEGTAVPYTILNNSLVFYGQAPTNRYTRRRVYVLEAGKAGVLMGETAVSPTPNAPTITTLTQTHHYEQNQLYESRARTPTNEAVWFWHKLQPDGTVTVDFNLPQLSDGSGQLTVSLWGLSSNPQTAPDHDSEVRINEHHLTTLQWDGAAGITKTIIIPPGILHSGHNQITFNNPTAANNPVDTMLLDWIELTYETTPTLTNQIFTINTQVGNVQLVGMQERPFIFDLTQPDNPERLTSRLDQNETIAFKATENRQYLAVTSDEMQHPAHFSLMRNRSWLEAVPGADFVIVTTDALKTAVSPLKTQRESEGLQVAVVSIEDIYDTFGDGHSTPQAIQTFLHYATQRWSPPPRYGLLVGDATTDFRGYVNQPPSQHIPSFMVPVMFGGETVSDALLADVDGDGRSDLALGRWPVSSKQAVAHLVKRTLAYENQPPLHAGSVIVDPTDPAFSRMAERLVRNGRFTFNTSHSPRPPDESGWLAVYIGHGSLTLWGQTGIITQDHLPAAMPPIILQFTCLTGLFAHPTQPSLSETMLNSSNGPVVIVAATSLTLSQHQEPFANALLEGVENTAVSRIGDAFLHAQQSLDTTANPTLQDIHNTFVLLGDPTTPIVRPTP